MSPQQIDGRGLQLPTRNDPIHQALRLGLRAGQAAPGQHELQRGNGTQRANRSPGAAVAGEDAEPDLRKTEAGRRIIGGDAVAASQRQFQPAAETEAVDQGQGRTGQRLDAVEESMDAADVSPRLGLIGQAFELTHIGPGDEPRFFQ